MAEESMLPVRGKRSFKYMPLLWAGLALWLALALLRYVLAWQGTHSVGNAAQTLWPLHTGARWGVLGLSLFEGVFLTLVDETLFRLWIKVRHTAVALLLFALMGVLFVLMGVLGGVPNAWWAGVAAFVACSATYLLLASKPEARFLALTAVTSLSYALFWGIGVSHAGPGMGADAALVAASTLGLGLALCWVVLNIGFLWAWLLHAAVGIVAVLAWLAVTPTPAQPVQPQALHISGEGYEAILAPGEMGEGGFRKVNDSTCVLAGELPAIAMDLVRYFDPGMTPRLWGYMPNRWVTYDLPSHKAAMTWRYTLTFHDSIPLHHAAHLAGDLVRQAPLRADTTYEPAYVLGIEDPSRFSSEMGGDEQTMAGLAHRLRITYDIPVTLETGANEWFPVSFKDETFINADQGMERLQEEMRKNGMKFYKSDFTKLQVVRFAYGEDGSAPATCRRHGQ